MYGLMQDVPLTLPMLMDGMETRFSRKKVVTHSVTGTSTTATYGDVAQRIRKLATVLDTLGIPESARVGTFAWNTQRHLELYMAVPSTKRVLHTINHRLFADDLVYIINDAEDDVIFIDRSILQVLMGIADRIPTVRTIVVMDDGVGMEVPDDDRFLDYEELIAAAEPMASLVVEDERTAASMCYTSGTTGRPKGVVYDHRSVILHAMCTMMADALGIGERDRVMPIVPMFHVNAWGSPFACIMSGAELVMPGNAMMPEQLAANMVDGEVTLSLAVPTIWRGMFPHLKDREVPHLRMLVSGGAALPVELSHQYREHVGVPLTNAWGMTETSPLVLNARVSAEDVDKSDKEKTDILSLAGVTIPIVQIRIRNEFDEDQPHDGTAQGELQVHGPTIAGSYFGVTESAGSFTDDGWLKTGDVVTISPKGYVKIVDRTKDLIKSGGEWISSAELENAIASAPGVAEAAVISRPDPRWDERPVGIIVGAGGVDPSVEAIKEYLAGKVAKWWIPDDYVFVDEIPKTATGKINKVQLRKSHGS